MLLDFARAGAESDSEAEGVRRSDEGSSMSMTLGRSVRGGGGGGGDVEGRKPARAPSKVMAKAQQLYDEHATNEYRKEQMRKVSLVFAVNRAHSCPGILCLMTLLRWCGTVHVYTCRGAMAAAIQGGEGSLVGRGRKMLHNGAIGSALRTQLCIFAGAPNAGISNSVLIPLPPSTSQSYFAACVRFYFWYSCSHRSSFHNRARSRRTLA